MTRIRMVFMAGASMLVATAGAGAQLRANASIPRGFEPPAGLCRVWYNGITPGRQPAPTDCATARANLRPNTRLVYGPSLRTDDQRNGAQGSWHDPVTGRAGDGRYDDGRYNDGRNNDGRYDRLSDKQRRELEKDRRKREKEREKEWKRAHNRNDRDDDRYDDRRDDRRGRGNTGINGGTTQGPWGRATGTPANGGQCVDANHDGICDNTAPNSHRWP